MMNNIYLAVRIYATFHLLYGLWIYLFHRKMYGLCDKLYRQARIMRVCIRRRRKRQIAARIERKKRHEMRKKKKKEETPNKIRVTDYDVIGKTKTVYIKEPLKSRIEPMRSEPLPESDFISEDDEISSDDVEDNLDTVTDTDDDEEFQELMEAPLSKPDPDFSQSMTYEDIHNMAEVLSGRETDEDKRIRAAEALNDIQDTDFFDFLVELAESREKVEALMREHFDEAVEPRMKTVPGTETATDFDWNLYV